MFILNFLIRFESEVCCKIVGNFCYPTLRNINTSLYVKTYFMQEMNNKHTLVLKR